ncbi:hypothetical protein VNO77_05910 [Canavalia gladiata]|uniref:lactoylglutathione lyase n=1 Tax=Canavalia gladiata TaxID=3824 RepID=A0AAN9R632_CANGL
MYNLPELNRNISVAHHVEEIRTTPILTGNRKASNRTIYGFCKPVISWEIAFHVHASASLVTVTQSRYWIEFFLWQLCGLAVLSYPHSSKHGILFIICLCRCYALTKAISLLLHQLAPCFSLKTNRSEAALNMADLLEWPKQDKRRLLHVVYRVGDLERTIKFYTECFGMKLLRQRDIPEEKYANAFLGFGPEESHFVVELTYNYGVTSYDIGDGFGHFAIATQDIYKLVEHIRANGGNITREPGPVQGGTAVIAFVKDPDGYRFGLIQRPTIHDPFCQIMLRVGDLERSIKFYEKALGMKVVRKVDKPEYKYTIVMLGYGEENETTVLELTYNYGVTEYSKGNAYAQIAIGTDDVYKSAEVVNQVIQEVGGKITRQPGPIPGLNTKITSFLDPDGWKTVLVDNVDFLKELE